MTQEPLVQLDLPDNLEMSEQPVFVVLQELQVQKVLLVLLDLQD